MQIGDKVQVKRTFTAEDLYAYTALGGSSPIDSQIPEPLLAGLFSYLLGMELPGVGTNYLKQETEYRRAAFVGEMITASVTITRLRQEKHLVDLKTVCKNSDGQTICSGRALVYIKDVI